MEKYGRYHTPRKGEKNVWGPTGPIVKRNQEIEDPGREFRVWIWILLCFVLAVLTLLIVTQY